MMGAYLGRVEGSARADQWVDLGNGIWTSLLDLGQILTPFPASLVLYQICPGNLAGTGPSDPIRVGVMQHRVRGNKSPTSSCAAATSSPMLDTAQDC